MLKQNLTNAFVLVRAELDKVSGLMKKPGSPEQKEMEVNAANKRIESTLEKIEGYLGEDIERLG